MTTITASSTIGIVLSAPSYTSPVVVSPDVSVYGPNYGIEATAGVWTVVNSGSVSTAGFGAGIVLDAGGSVTNQAVGVVSGYTGISGAGAALTVVNAGLIGGDTAASFAAGARLSDGGLLSNLAGGTISGYRAIYGTGAAVTVVNAGSIAGGAGYGSAGIELLAGGTVTNLAGGQVTGYSGIYAGNAPLTVVNDGVISGMPTGADADGIVIAAGGSVTNAAGGTISGAGGIYAFNIAATVVNAGGIVAEGSVAVGVLLSAGGSVTNRAGGTITGSAWGVQVFDGGSVGNAGLISGTDGGGVDLTAGGTLGNAGTIAGADGVAAVFGNTVANRLVLYPGAVFDGQVQADPGSVNALELAAGTNTGSLGAIGDILVRVGSLIVDNGANWVQTDAAVLDAGGLADVGRLTLDDSTLLVGSLTGSGSVTIAAGSTLYVQGSVAAGVTIVFDGPGGVLDLADAADQDGTVVGFGDGDAIRTHSGPQTVTNTATLDANGFYGVLLDSGGWVTNSSGATIAGSDGGVFISGGAGSVANAGMISGATLYGIDLRAGGTIGNAASATVFGGGSGIYVSGAAGSVANAGTILGTAVDGIALQAGGVIGNADGGLIAGGIDGVYATGGAASVVNSGTIQSSLTGGSGFGVYLTSGGGVSNSAGGLISGYDAISGAGGVSVVNAGQLTGIGTGGAGVYVYGPGSVTNQAGGSISGTGGVIGSGRYTGFTVVNAGSITGDATVSFGDAVGLFGGGGVSNQSGGVIAGFVGVAIALGGSVVNAGNIAGTSATVSGAGITLSQGGSVSNLAGGQISGYIGIEAVGGGSATVYNAGGISGVTYAVTLAGGYANRVILAPNATFVGLVDGGNPIGAGAVSTLELVPGDTAGTLSGLGTQYIDFGQINVDPGATWTLTGGSLAMGGGVHDAGTLTNADTLNGAVTLAGGGILTNAAGGIISVASGPDVYSPGASAASVVNAGLISNIGCGTGILLTAGGGVANLAGGTIAGYQGIVGGYGGALSVLNAGLISGDPAGYADRGIYLQGGGSVTNLAGGTISGTYRAVYGGVLSGPLTVVNAGTVLSTAEDAGVGIIMNSGGTVINQAGGVIQSSVEAVYTQGFNSTVYVVNAGTINGGAGAGLELHDTGVVNNQSGGVITAYLGVQSKYAATSLVNAGTIAGSTFALRLAEGYSNIVTVDPGAVFDGYVGGGNPIGGFYVSTLELAGTTPGTLSGIGTQFYYFAQTTVDSGADWTLTNTNSFAAGTTLTNAGTLTLSGTYLSDAGLVTNDGSIVLDPSTLVAAALTGAGVVEIDPGSTLDATGTVAAGQTIVFEPGPSVLDLDPGGFSGQIDGFSPGQTIVLSGVTDGTLASIVNANTLQVTRSDNPPVELTLDPTVNHAGETFTVSGGDSVTENVPCFLDGTLIRTPAGERPVEALAVGDRVVTLSGQTRPITWIGQGRVMVSPGRRGAATPVIVRKGALADNVPHRDLRITKGHALFVDGVLIPVEFLVNHRGILWDDHRRTVRFHHLRLDAHDVLLANGAAAESYRDDGNRWLFRAETGCWQAEPEPACAPVLTGGPIVDAAWRRLLNRTGPRPGATLTDDPDFHLLVDGACVDAQGRVGDVHVFPLARRPSDVRLVSRAAAPQELGLARDPRLLGVAVRRIVARQGNRFRVTEAEDGLLAEGFHAFEPLAGVRWTDGQAALPGAVFGGFEGPLELLVQLGGATRYADGMSVRRAGVSTGV
jgi:hypothetical protein